MISIIVGCLIVIAIVFYMFYIQRKNQNNKRKILDKLKNSGCWIEIADNQLNPLFQGWLYTVTEDSYGIAIGVFLEKDRNPELLKNLKKDCAIEYLEDGKMIAKALIDFESNVVFSDLTDTELKTALQNVIDPDKSIDVLLQIDSESIMFTENAEAEHAFYKVWKQKGHFNNRPNLDNSHQSFIADIHQDSSVVLNNHQNAPSSD